MDRARALDLAEKVLALVDGGKTPGERAAALAALNRLKERHNLTIEEVRDRKTVEDVIVAEVRHDYWRIHQWVKVLAASVAIAFHCRVVFSFYPNPEVAQEPTRPNLRRYIFIGAQSEAEQASFFFDIFHNKLSTMAEQKGRAEGFSGKELLAFINAFVVSAARTIKEKLEEWNWQQFTARIGINAPMIRQEENREDNPADNEDSELSPEEEARLQTILDQRAQDLSDFLGSNFDHTTQPKFSITRRTVDENDHSAGIARGLQEGILAGQDMAITPGLAGQTRTSQKRLSHSRS